MFHISVDASRCQGHARCIAFAPEVFDVDDEGYSFVAEQKRRYAELPEGVRLAIANCPERAIVLTELPS
jgi:ferredoxin